MNKTAKFLFNGSLLAATTLLLRLTGLGFSAYISRQLGAEGTGLISLVNTVYGFGITFAVSGIYLACIRLCSAAIGRKNDYELHTALQKSFLYAAFFGFLSCLLFTSLASFAGTRFLQDGRTVDSIRMLAIALPFISLTTVTDAYFASVGRVYKSAVSDICEQAVKIISGMILLKSSIPFGTQASVLAVTKSNCIGEIAAFFVSIVLYLHDIRTTSFAGERNICKTESLLRISLPIAFSTYARSGLVTLEHSLIPKGLQRYGADKTDALSAYGVVRGMALPIILFPACLLSAFTGLLVPELTEDHTINDQNAINRKSSQAIRISSAFSVITAVILFLFGNELGMSIHKNEQAGFYIRCFSVLIPFMYCDTTADSLLKGLDKQVYTMIVNIIDAAVSVLFTWKIIPKLGIRGYVITVFMTEILNFSCSAGKLSQMTKLNFNPVNDLFVPICVTAGTGIFVQKILSVVRTANMNLYCISGIGCSLLISIPLVARYSFINEWDRIRLIAKKKTTEPFWGSVAREN